MHSRRSHLTLFALIVVALVGVAFLAVPGSPVEKKPTLGLDLQGGLEVVLQAVTPKGHKLTQADLDRSVGIMRNRVDKLGVSEPEIRKQGNNQIVIELAGVHDPRKAAAIIGKTAKLELYDLETSVSGPSKGAGPGVIVPKTRLYDLLAPVKAKAASGTPTAYYLFDKQKSLVAGPIASKQAIDKIQAKKPGTTLLAAPEKTIVITCDSVSSQVCPGLPSYPVPGKEYFYLFEHDPTGANPVPQMTGEDLNLSGTRQDIDPSNNQPVVLMKFTKKGNKLFHEITKQEAVRGSALQQPQHFAIVLDNEIRSWPQIDYTQLPNGIDPTGSGAQITGLSSIGEARDIALV
ncbi:MAG TPA: hypothetical protein VLN26_10535, partial [Gaiellaceae bacterium]|nr:hypothetical protein [Gaiellaceae bacterium]